MSANIKYLSLLGFIHAAIACTIAYLAVRKSYGKQSFRFVVTCFLIATVLLINLTNQGRGLELFGRWIGGD